MDSPAPDPPMDANRLNGWKEIAGFLGKGVRTVQRWERDLRLPVHRLGREGGEIVFAFKTEISAWSLAQGEPRRGEAARAASGPNGAVATRDGHPRAPRRGWIIAAAALAVAAAAVAALLVLDAGWLGPPPQPASWRVIGDTLTVFGENGASLWSHRFPTPLVSLGGSGQYGSPSSPLVSVVDFDGDGNREVLFGVRAADMRGPVQGFYVFNHDGSERFAFRPTPVVHFGETDYRAPWLFHKMFLTHRPGREASIWVVFVHGMEFPTLLVELDAKGHVVSEYWSNGYVNSVDEGTWGNTAAVLVGAANNETHGASLAVFERDHVSGSAPAVDPDYRCVDCPKGDGPVAYLLFPRRCVGRAQEGNATVTETWTDAGGRLHVSVTEWSPLPSRPAGSVFYWLSPDLVPERAEVSAEFRMIHQQMERAGLLDHSFGPADEAKLFPVRRWNGSAFVDLPPAPVTR